MSDIKKLAENLLFNLLLSLLGAFSAAMKNFIMHMREELADNPTLEQTADIMIARVQEEHPEWSWVRKFEYVSQAGLDHFAEVGKDIARASWNALVDVKIVDKRIQAGELPTPAERRLGSTTGGQA